MSIFEHAFLYSFLFIIFYFWGRYFSSSSSRSRFCISALFPIFLYGFIVGSRYGWGVDYDFYKYRLENAFTFEEEQIGFKFLNQAISHLGLNYVGGYIVYSLLFIICAFVLIRSYGKDARYMYAFFIPSTLIFTTSIIRQGISVGFLFLMIYFINKKKWIGVFFSIIFGVSIHFGIFVPIVIFFAIYFLFKKPISWKITIPLLLFVVFIYDVGSSAIVVQYLPNISFTNKFQSYIDNSERWFGQDAIDNNFEQSKFALIMSTIYYSATIYLGYTALKAKGNRTIIAIFNSVSIGYILFRMVFLFEILKRFIMPIIMLDFIILGYIISIYTSHFSILTIKSSFKRIYLFRLLMLGIILYLILYWGRFIFMSPDKIFFWNI